MASSTNEKCSEVVNFCGEGMLMVVFFGEGGGVGVLRCLVRVAVFRVRVPDCLVSVSL